MMADNDDDMITVAAAAWYLWEADETENAEIERGQRPYKKRRERRYWIHDVVRKRQELSERHRLILELRGDLGRFRQYFRMSTAQFDTLTNMFGPEIVELSTNWRQSISPAERLARTLRYVEKFCFICLHSMSFYDFPFTSYYMWSRDGRKDRQTVGWDATLMRLHRDGRIHFYMTASLYGSQHVIVAVEDVAK